MSVTPGGYEDKDVPTRKFDLVILVKLVFSFKKLSCVRKTVKQNVDVQMQLDLRNDTYSQFLKIISTLLRRSLGKRVSQIYHSVEPSSLSWFVNEKIPRYGNVMFALKIDSEYAYDVIDKGPTANLPDVSALYFIILVFHELVARFIELNF